MEVKNEAPKEAPKEAHRRTSTKVAPMEVKKEVPMGQAKEEPKEDPIPLWDQAYDALKDHNPSLIRDYEDLLSRALQQSKQSFMDPLIQIIKRYCTSHFLVEHC